MNLLKPPKQIAGRRPLRILPLIGVSGSRGPLYATGTATVTVGGEARALLQPETFAWLARCPPGFAAQHYWYALAVSRFITTGKHDGWWAKFDEIWMTGAPLQAVANLGLKGNFDLTPVNAPIWSRGSGYIFDKATNYLETGINPATYGGQYTQNDGSLFFWVMNEEGVGLYVVAGALSVDARISLRSRNVSSALFHCNSTTGDFLPVTQSRGMLGFSRRSGAEFVGMKSGNLTTYVRTATPLPDGMLRIGRLGNGATYSGDQVIFGAIGGGLTDDQMVSLYNAQLAFLIETGSISDDDPDPPEVYGYGAFDQDELALVTPPGLEIVQQAPPPGDDTYTGSNFVYFPMTIASTQGVERTVTSTRSDIEVEHFIWAPRDRILGETAGIPNRRPNLIYPQIRNEAGQECRIFFDDFVKADAAWIVAQRYSAGALPRDDGRYPDGMGWLDYAEAAGYDISGWDDVSGSDLTDNVDIDTSGGRASNVVLHHANLAANPDSYFTVNGYSFYRTGTNIISLPVARAADSETVPVTSFLRDTEEQTGRSPAALLAALTECAASCHATGHRMTVYANPLNAPGAIATGIAASNAWDIMQVADRISIFAWANNIERDILASLDNQWTILKGPAGNKVPNPAKIVLVVGLGARGQEMSIADATKVRNWFTAKGILRVMFWRAGAVQGGARSRQVNQVIAIICGLDRNAPGPTPPS